MLRLSAMMLLALIASMLILSFPAVVAVESEDRVNGVIFASTVHVHNQGRYLEDISVVFEPDVNAYQHYVLANQTDPLPFAYLHVLFDGLCLSFHNEIRNSDGSVNASEMQSPDRLVSFPKSAILTTLEFQGEARLETKLVSLHSETMSFCVAFEALTAPGHRPGYRGVVKSSYAAQYIGKVHIDVVLGEKLHWKEMMLVLFLLALGLLLAIRCLLLMWKHIRLLHTKRRLRA